MTKPHLLDRGRYGFAVRFDGDFLAAMPDEATARKVAAVDDLAELLAVVSDYLLDHDNGLGPSLDRLRAAVAKVQDGIPRAAEAKQGELVVDDTGDCLGCQ